MPELDRYEEAGIDDQEHSEINVAQRRAIERKLDLEQRQRQYMMDRRPDALMEDCDDYSDTNLNTMDRRFPILGGRGQEDDGSEQGDVALINDYSDIKEPLSSWLQKQDVVLFIRKKFGMFLRNFVDDNDQHVYEARIQEMCQNNKQSMEVNFTHLSDKQPTLAIWLAEEPASVLPILNETAAEIVAEVYPDYHKIHD